MTPPFDAIGHLGVHGVVIQGFILPEQGVEDRVNPAEDIVGHYGTPIMISTARSATAIAVALVLPLTMYGIMETSTTHNPSIPLTSWAKHFYRIDSASLFFWRIRGDSDRPAAPFHSLETAPAGRG